jgi:hypothetical protein
MPFLVIITGIFLALRRRAKARSLAVETAAVKSVDEKEPQDAV